MKKRKYGNGFSLVELLVVITIVSLLSVLASVGYGFARTNSRDGKRKEDLKNYSNALKQYRLISGKYYLGSTGEVGVNGNSYGKISLVNASSYTSTSIANYLLVNGYITSEVTDPFAKNPKNDISSADYILIRCNQDKSQSKNEVDSDFGIIAKMEKNLSVIDGENTRGGCGDKLLGGAPPFIVYDYADGGIIDGVSNTIFLEKYYIQR